MKKLILILSILILSACGSTRHIQEKDNTYVHVIDSIAWHDSTIVSYITKERIVDIVIPPDTLKMETEYAKASAYLDTSIKALKGTLENKSDIPIEKTIKWKERIIRDTLIVYKDKEVPVEVEKIKEVVPKWSWYTLGFSILFILVIILKIYLKFKR